MTGPGVSELIDGELFVRRWEAVASLVLWVERRLVFPLFISSGAILLLIGDADGGEVEVGPAALTGADQSVWSHPGLYPAVLAMVMALQLLVTSPFLSYLMSLRLRPAPDRSGLLSRITGGVRLRDRWSLTLAITGLRGMSTSLDAAVEVAGAGSGAGGRLHSLGIWSRRVVFGLTAAAIAVVVVGGGDAGFNWKQ
jgi:hypothetical protein